MVLRPLARRAMFPVDTCELSFFASHACPRLSWISSWDGVSVVAKARGRYHHVASFAMCPYILTRSLYQRSEIYCCLASGPWAPQYGDRLLALWPNAYGEFTWLMVEISPYQEQIHFHVPEGQSSRRDEGRQIVSKSRIHGRSRWAIHGLC